MNTSSLHTLAIVTNCELAANTPVRTARDIAIRLKLTQEALGLSSADLCRDTGIKPNAWSQFTNPEKKRRITMTAAWKLKDTYGITLEWIYDNDRSRLPADIVAKLRRAAAA